MARIAVKKIDDMFETAGRIYKNENYNAMFPFSWAKSLEGETMTWLTTQNFEVGKGITANTAYVVRFPFTSPFPTPVCPYQLLVASNIVMIMPFPSTLAFTPCPSPRLFNNRLRKRHISPPLIYIVLLTYYHVNYNHAIA